MSVRRWRTSSASSPWLHSALLASRESPQRQEARRIEGREVGILIGLLAQQVHPGLIDFLDLGRRDGDVFAARVPMNGDQLGAARFAFGVHAGNGTDARRAGIDRGSRFESF